MSGQCFRRLIVVVQYIVGQQRRFQEIPVAQVKYDSLWCSFLFQGAASKDNF